MGTQTQSIDWEFQRKWVPFKKWLLIGWISLVSVPVPSRTIQIHPHKLICQGKTTVTQGSPLVSAKTQIILRWMACSDLSAVFIELKFLTYSLMWHWLWNTNPSRCLSSFICIIVNIGVSVGAHCFQGIILKCDSLIIYSSFLSNCPLKIKTLRIIKYGVWSQKKVRKSSRHIPENVLTSKITSLKCD